MITMNGTVWPQPSASDACHPGHLGLEHADQQPAGHRKREGRLNR